ncbi:acetolactate synthase 2 catalytic subunit [Kangiella marina]|uniref:Acetolactate synthase n=1 Tax=Kangiella marina TaxID=1079178 RepID=A0ABP8IHQ2_9GAMM
MRGADYLIKTLKDHQVDTVFGYPGGAIMPVYDALLGSGVKHVLCRHEQGAVFAADGYARSSGRLGVCLATSGPGATNLITGIANAQMDSVPLLAITGQVASNLIGTDAFQEIDTYGLSLSVVKHSYLVTRIEDFPHMLNEAIQLAQSGRPGPVLIDIAKDVQMATMPATSLAFCEEMRPKALSSTFGSVNQVQLMQAAHLLTASKQPLVYAGGGVDLARCSELLTSMIERFKLPTVTTLKGIGSVPSSHPYNLGMLGMHGTKAANTAVQDCDLLLVAGARLDDRATGDLQQFAPRAKVIHIDCDHAEVSKLRRADVSLVGDMHDILTALADRLETSFSQQTAHHWRYQCLHNKEQLAFRYDAPFSSIYAPSLLKNLSARCSQSKAIVTCDVGQHQMWVAQHMQFNSSRHHLSSGGLGAMGYGLPAALGAKFANPDFTVINVSGDGSIMMNIQELATLKRYGIAVKILLLDNQRLGMVRQWQNLFFEQRFSEVDLSDNPNFAEIANAFGIRSHSISQSSEVEAALDDFLANDDSYLLHVSINPDDNVWPLVPPGKSNADYIEESFAE